MENLDQKNNKNVSLSLIAEYGISDSESEGTESPAIENMTNDECEDGVQLSDMVLKNNIINACAHGPLSGSSMREDEDTTRHMIIDSTESGVVEYEVTEYRDVDSESDANSSSDSSDSDVDSVKDVEELSSSDENETAKSGGKLEPPKVLGELGLDDLPPIEDLAISLPPQETTKIGTIASIVDRLVIVRAFPETPAIDIDSVLFLENGSKALGKVFDVFGPVTEPHYCVRFNSAEHVKERGVQPGLEVFIAPKSQHTNYVFLNELMKVKGSDASWLNDVEPPSHQVEYSDDEEERRAKKQQKQKQNNEHESETGEEIDRSQASGRKTQEGRRNHRPSDSSSRFGSGPSRGRNPFSASSRRNQIIQPTIKVYPRFGRPWPVSMDTRTPPHPNDPGGQSPFSPLPFPPIFPPPFNPSTPPPIIGNGYQGYQFGSNPRMQGSPMPMGMPPVFRRNGPVFGSNYCNVPDPNHQWINNGPPPPPGT